MNLETPVISAGFQDNTSRLSLSKLHSSILPFLDRLPHMVTVCSGYLGMDRHFDSLFHCWFIEDGSCLRFRYHPAFRWYYGAAVQSHYFFFYRELEHSMCDLRDGLDLPNSWSMMYSYSTYNKITMMKFLNYPWGQR
ncbi:hypothetical protein Tco_1255745 [Tanacetum coccineum]